MLPVALDRIRPERSSHRVQLSFRVLPTAACLFRTPYLVLSSRKAQSVTWRGSKPPSKVWVPSVYCQLLGAGARVGFLMASQGHQALHPQGLEPSRRFAPRTTCRVCFAPTPLLGLYPPRVYSSVDARGSFELGDPPGLSHLSFRRGAVPSGLFSPTQ